MKFSSQAQSTLEYVTIAALIMVGILIMGPYTIRAINAQFKGSSEQVKDSFREEPHQAPPTGEDLPDCDCTDLLPQECGNGVTCDWPERHYVRTCSPQGCQTGLQDFGINYVMEECRPDDTCCDPEVWTGRCGVNATNVQPAGRCPDGYGEMSRNCGGPPPTVLYNCSADIMPQCVFQCLGAQSADSAWCDPVGYNQDLPSDLPIQHVAPGACPPTPNNKCMSECSPPFVPIGGGADCGCQPPKVKEGGQCVLRFRNLQCFDGNVENLCGPGTCAGQLAPAGSSCYYYNYSRWDGNSGKNSCAGGCVCYKCYCGTCDRCAPSACSGGSNEDTLQCCPQNCYSDGNTISGAGGC